MKVLGGDLRAVLEPPGDAALSYSAARAASGAPAWLGDQMAMSAFGRPPDFSKSARIVASSSMVGSRNSSASSLICGNRPSALRAPRTGPVRGQKPLVQIGMSLRGKRTSVAR
nr:hypothetical protein [Kribbella pittospori]